MLIARFQSIIANLQRGFNSALFANRMRPPRLMASLAAELPSNARWIGVAMLLFAALVMLPSPHVFAQQLAQDGQDDPEERDLKFAFTTTLGSDEDGELDPQNKDIPDLSDGDLLSGSDLLKRLDASDISPGTAMLRDHSLAAYILHPASGKSFELQIGTCKALDFATGEPPYPQQVQCDKDLYSYRAGPHGVEILINNELFFDIPLDEGDYRLNGVDVTFTTPPSDKPSEDTPDKPKG